MTLTDFKQRHGALQSSPSRGSDLESSADTNPFLALPQSFTASDHSHSCIPSPIIFSITPLTTPLILTAFHITPPLNTATAALLFTIPLILTTFHITPSLTAASAALLTTPLILTTFCLLG
ncbi:hypothetical protein AAFF_G00361500 [Aldrovandia affinis]|uniref:Uncharacterized protein n=1 Tax=Aldrovandia affinis TaxID=143900 RepID=A0AAD7WMT8_9TELE|nr:hypothetical protein AAFF_G00361500 [Aldrovandia affinis]